MKKNKVIALRSVRIRNKTEINILLGSYRKNETL